MNEWFYTLALANAMHIRIAVFIAPLTMQQHGSRTSFSAVLQSQPGLQVLSHLGVQDLRCLAYTCHSLKEAVTLAILPTAKDVTEAQESTPIACRFTLPDVAALLDSVKGPAPALACQW